MPSIANQDFKIYGKLSPKFGVPGFACGELYAAVNRAVTASEKMLVADGFVFESDNTTPCRQLSPGIYYDQADGEMKKIELNFEASYYDALWAIQQAVYAHSEDILAGETEFGLADGVFQEEGYGGGAFVNEDGYIIKGTAADGILASLYLGEKAENPENCAVVRLESLLPLVGVLPLETTEIW